MRCHLLPSLLLGLCICLNGLTADRAAAAATPTRTTAMVPMRDGTLLATDVYLPAGDPPWPVALARTPYGKANVGNHTGIQPSRFANNGIALVVQDVRGRFASGGTARPNLDDG